MLSLPKHLYLGSNQMIRTVILSLPKHLYLGSNPIKRNSIEVKMLRQAQHDRLFA